MELLGACPSYNLSGQNVYSCHRCSAYPKVGRAYAHRPLGRTAWLPKTEYADVGDSAQIYVWPAGSCWSQIIGPKPLPSVGTSVREALLLLPASPQTKTRV
jgi:hypothetical protein